MIAMNRQIYRAFRKLHHNSICCRSNSMQAWQISDCLEANEVDIQSRLKLVETKIPTLSSPFDVLVKVHSTSVNPIDVLMVNGYGRRVLDLLNMFTNLEPRITNDRFPLILGRDFSGEVVATGPCAKMYKVGEQVFGAVEPQKQGAHAEYVSVPSYCLTKKPTDLSHNEAASIPFVALTAYSALSTIGGLNRDNCPKKHILVIGGSGGVGSFSIQLLKAWGANVVATCSEDKMEWLENTLFVDQAICHHDQLQIDSLNGKYDFILDCGSYGKTGRTRRDITETSLKYLRPHSQAVYVTLSPPILANTDKFGIVKGGATTLIEAVEDTIRGLVSLNSARWAVFLPNQNALESISRLYQDGSITPQISSVFSFNETPKAFEELKEGKVRGKLVIDVTKLSEKPVPKP